MHAMMQTIHTALIGHICDNAYDCIILQITSAFQTCVEMAWSNGTFGKKNLN